MFLNRRYNSRNSNSNDFKNTSPTYINLTKEKIKSNFKIITLLVSSNSKQFRHSSDPESIRSSSTASNKIPSSTTNRNYIKPPFVNKSSLIRKIIVKNTSNEFQKDNISGNKNNIQINVMNINANREPVMTQNNYLETANPSNSNSKTAKKGSVNSTNHSYLLNFKEKQKMSNSNSNNIEKKGKFFIILLDYDIKNCSGPFDLSSASDKDPIFLREEILKTFLIFKIICKPYVVKLFSYLGE